MQAVESGAGRGNAGAPGSVTLNAERGLGLAVLKAMSDLYSSKIMESVVSEGRSVEEISAATGVPVSTAYRRIHRMTGEGLTIVERVVITREGKKHRIYRATFSRVRAELEPQSCRVEGTPNEGIPDIMYRLWQFEGSERAPMVNPF